MNNTCQICQKVHISKGSLAAHIKAAHKISKDEYAETYLGIHRVKCRICDESLLNNLGLAKHLTRSHPEVNHQEYYDSNIRTPDQNCSCQECGNTAIFKSLHFGYGKSCSGSCGVTIYRREQKADPGRFKAFQDKVSANQTRIWAERESDGTKADIQAKAAKANQEIIYRLSKEERQERFGWMNKLTGQEKIDKVNEILDKSLRKWWNEATEDQLNEMRKNKMATMVKNGNGHIPNLGDFKGYANQVRRESGINYKKFKNIINPLNLPRGRGIDKYHLDHIVSVCDCFNNGVTVESAASVGNLQMLLGHVNTTKSSESWGDVNLLKEKTI